MIPLWVFFLAWVVLILALAIYVYVFPLWAERRDAELERGLDAQSQQEIGRQKVRDRQALKELHETWKTSVSLLKTSRAGRRKKPLYFFPWYAIIGAPASGKSTAIQNSGLRFPIGVPKLSGTGGTRNCDWWFADEAIILDTAGRYTFDEEYAPDQEEWLAFLKLLRKYRPRAPLNGLIIAVAADTILSGDRESIAADSRNLRKKIDQIVRELGIQFPIYLLVTKCDLIEGFTDFFGRLPKKRLDEMLGWTSPSRDVGDPSRTISTALAELRGCILKLRPAQMGDVEGKEELRRVFLFPEEMEALCASLEVFCLELFRETEYNESPFLRGIYLTSGLQQGTTVSRMLQRLGMRTQATELREEKRSYFLKDLFQTQLTEDRNLVASTGRSRGKLQAFQNLGFAAVVAVCLGIVLLTGGSYVRNRLLLIQLQDEVERAASSVALPPIERLQGLDQYSDALRALSDHNQNRPISMGYGLYMGKRVYEPALQLFLRRFDSDAYSPAITAALRAVETRDLERGFGGLVAVIQNFLLSKQLNGTQAQPYGSNDQLVAFWPGAAQYDMAQLANQENLLGTFARTYFSFLRWRPEAAARADEASELGYVRQALPIMFTVDKVAQRADRLFPAKSGEGIPLSPAIANGATVSGAFTPEAWNEWIQPLSDRVGLIADSVDTPDLVARFHRAYFDRYFGSWLRFFLQLGVGPPGTAKDEIFLTDRSPYLMAVDFVDRQIGVEGGRPYLPAWGQSLFAYREQRPSYVTLLQATGTTLRAGQQDSLSAVAGAKEIFRRPAYSPLSAAADQDAPPDPFGKVEQWAWNVFEKGPAIDPDDLAVRRQAAVLLREPIYDVFGRYLRIAAQRIDDLWRREVVIPASASGGFSAKDGGTAVGFIKENVEPFLEGGLNSPFKIRYRHSLPVDKSRFAFIDEAQRREAEIGDGAGGFKPLRLVFTSIPTNSPGEGGFLPTRTTFSVLCQDGGPWQHVHQNFRTVKQLTWSPDQCAKAEITVEIANAEGMKKPSVVIGADGPMGLAKLLLRADRRGDEFTWHLDGGVDVTYLISGVPARTLSVMTSGGVKPPGSILR